MVRTRVEYVEVTVVVTDKDGRFVGDPRREDSELLDEGKRQTIRAFAKVDIPLTAPSSPQADATRMLGALRGRRKSILYFSEGTDYNVADIMGRYRRYASEVSHWLADALSAATRNNVTVYGTDPRGPAPSEGEATEIPIYAERHVTSLTVNARRGYLVGSDRAGTARAVEVRNVPAALTVNGSGHADNGRQATLSLRLTTEEMAFELDTGTLPPRQYVLQVGLYDEDGDQLVVARSVPLSVAAPR